LAGFWHTFFLIFMPQHKGCAKSGGRKKGAIEPMPRKRRGLGTKTSLSRGLKELAQVARDAGIPLPARPEVEEMARQYAPIALASLAYVAARSPSHPARVSASVALLDRAFGRPNQAVQITGTLAVRTLSDAELIDMAERMAAHFHTIEGRADGFAGEFPTVATGGPGEVRPDFVRDGTPGTDSHNLAPLP
jgi:hypothetical protein